MAKLSEMLLTQGDKKRLAIVRDLIDQATKEKKRSGQVLALLDAQKELMGIVHWFIARDAM